MVQVPKAQALRSDPEIKENLKPFLRTDNFTNLLYIGRAYLVLGISIGGAIAFFEMQQALGFSIWWGLPIYLVAIFPTWN